MLSVRIFLFSSVEEEIKAGAKPGPCQIRKFLVKYQNLSYWKCEWIDEVQVSGTSVTSNISIACSSILLLHCHFYQKR